MGAKSIPNFRFSAKKRRSGAPSLSFLFLLQLFECGELQAAAEDLHRLLQLLHRREGRSDADAALISDIVTSQTDYMLSQVRIIEVKP